MSELTPEHLVVLADRLGQCRLFLRAAGNGAVAFNNSVIVNCDLLHEVETALKDLALKQEAEL